MEEVEGNIISNNCSNKFEELYKDTNVNLNNIQRFKSITNEMAKTYAAKNHDYGNSFEQSLDKFGLVASVVRIGDKMNRIESLMKKEAQVKDESIKDTLLDLASYSVMTLMWLNKQQSDKK